MKPINKEIMADMIRTAPDQKKKLIEEAMDINDCLTSNYDLDPTLRVYKEGFYLTLAGTRSGVSIWCYDDDGDLRHGRKPNESKLSFLYEDNGRHECAEIWRYL